MDLARRPGGRRSSGQSSGVGVMIESGEARGRAQCARGARPPVLRATEPCAVIVQTAMKW
jgi:hypothetical protein